LLLNSSPKADGDAKSIELKDFRRKKDIGIKDKVAVNSNTTTQEGYVACFETTR
jgi:hypothetical protein